MAGIPDEIPDAVAGAAKAVRGAAEGAADHPVVQTGARLGYAVSGALHLVMGGLALRLATGDHSATPDQSGALGTLAGTPAGWILLGLTALGLGLLALWQIVQALRRSPANRVKLLAKAVAYLALAAGALSFITGSAESSSKQAADFTAQLMGLPFGVILVVVAGLVVIGIGVFHLVKGLQRRFLADLVEQPPALLIKAATAGYVAKGIALGMAGVLLLQAAWSRDPGQSTGLDGALETLLRAPAGQIVVALIGLGFVAYGLYSLARARYARV